MKNLKNTAPFTQFVGGDERRWKKTTTKIPVLKYDRSFFYASFFDSSYLKYVCSLCFILFLILYSERSEHIFNDNPTNMRHEIETNKKKQFCLQFPLHPVELCVLFYLSLYKHPSYNCLIAKKRRPVKNDHVMLLLFFFLLRAIGISRIKQPNERI